jgi:hypothetical protein
MSWSGLPTTYDVSGARGNDRTCIVTCIYYSLPLMGPYGPQSLCLYRISNLSSIQSLRNFNTASMTVSSSLVLYRPGPSSSLTTTASSASLISSRFFNQQTGTAIATELLYRLLFDLINRFLASFQRIAARGMEEASSWVERKLQERRERLQVAKDGTAGIVEEVGKLAQEQGFITCPMGGQSGARRQPPWVKSVLEGIEEGRLHDKDFYTNSW